MSEQQRPSWTAILLVIGLSWLGLYGTCRYVMHASGCERVMSGDGGTD